MDATPSVAETKPLEPPARVPRLRVSDVPELVLVLLGAAAVVAMLVATALRQDRAADAATIGLVSTLLRAECDEMERIAALHAGLGAGDPGLGGAVRRMLVEVEGIDLVLRVDPDHPPSTSGTHPLDGVATELARQALARGGPVSAFQAGEGTAPPWHLAAAPGGAGAALVIARALDDAALSRLGRLAGLYDLAPLPAAPADAASLPLTGTDGAAVAHLSWQSPRPGWDLVGQLVLPVAAVLVTMASMALLAVRRSVRAAGAVEDHAHRLRTANRDLARSHRRFRDFAESASDWFWETGPDHRYVYVSERLARIVGETPGGLFGERLTDLAPLVEDRVQWREVLADIEARRPFRDLELTWNDGGERARVFRIGGVPVFDEAGRFAGYRGSGVDATLETMALVEARFMQVVVHDALDSISEGFVLFNADGRLLFCNDRYRQAYPNLADVLVPGITFEEVLRVAAERGNFEEARADIGAWVRHRLSRHLSGEPVDQQLSNGHWYRISEHATGSGGVVKILVDITELKAREQELAGQTARLAESERRYRQLVELAPFGIAIHSAAGVRFANSAAATILGADTPEALEGTRLASFFDAGEAVERRVVSAAGHALPQRFDAVVLRAGGERRFVELGAWPAVHAGIPAALIVMNDVTERRRTEEELQRSQKMEAVGRMAGGIAHEFNNMLTAIGGFARLAEREPGDEARVLTCVREIAKASDRAAALTAQLLDFSRRRAAEEAETVALGELVRDLRVFLKPLMSAGIDLEIDIRDPDAYAVANPVTLNQALLNLALNARDAMPAGGRLTVTLDTAAPDDAFFARHDAVARGRFAAIRVTDDGCGVPPDIRDRIWEPFFTTKEPGKGTGLGLWMVYGTARQAGGTVEMDSEVGVGSAFTIFLPLADPPRAPAVASEPVMLPDGETAVILLADDEESVRCYFRLTLESGGCKVVEAVDGRDALEKYDEHGGLFDLVVTDVAMPRMGGGDLARELEARNPYVRILFLTGYASKGQAAQFMDRPERHLLMKPVTPDRLLAAVRDLLAE